MSFPRFTIDVDPQQLEGLLYAARTWGAVTVAQCASDLPRVTALQPVNEVIKRAVRLQTRMLHARRQGKKPVRNGLMRLTFTVPEGAGFFHFVGEEYAGGWALHLRLVRGQLHQQLINIPGVNL